MSSPQPLGAAGALYADVENFLGSRAVMYRTAEALDTAGAMSRNEIAAAMAAVSSRPTILDYLKDRRMIAAITEDLRAAGLDGVFGVAGPGPLRPNQQMTVTMAISPAELEDPVSSFARLHRLLAKRRLMVVPPPRSQIETAEALGMAPGSPPVDLLLAGGEAATVKDLPPKHPHRPASPDRAKLSRSTTPPELPSEPAAMLPALAPES